MADIMRLEKADENVLQDINALLKELSDTSTPSTRELLGRAVKNPSIEIWIAKEGERIIGMGEVAIIVKVSYSIAHIEDVVVASSARGKGIGTLIMQKLIERAKALGASEIQLTSRSGRAAANKLYQKLGFELRETNVYRLTL